MLLFVTNRDRLRAKIGSEGAEHTLQKAAEAGEVMADAVVIETGSRPTIEAVQSHISDASTPFDGLVIIGGYEVIPSVRLDVLDDQHRIDVPTKDLLRDPDGWYVWSDDAYVMGDGLLPSMPVSRILDGDRADILLSQLQGASELPTTKRFGMRSADRIYADDIFSNISGSGNIHVCPPVNFTNLEVDEFGTHSHSYFVVHGADDDGSRFMGIDGDGEYDAVTAALVTSWSGVVFTSACWGGLISYASAWESKNGPARCRDQNESLATKFLASGARCVVAPTAAHYSPADAEPARFGQPLHTEFWSRIKQGVPPAKALWEAKLAYRGNGPYGPLPIDKAIESKILREFTCFGFGW